MMQRWRAAWLSAIAFLLLQGAGTAQSPTERDREERRRVDVSRFEHQADADGMTLGAFYTGRTLIAGRESLVVRKHLVVEVLLVPPNSDGIRVSHDSFQLRINDEKEPRFAQSPGVVAYAIRNADVALGPRLTAEASVGDGGVVWDSRTPRRDPRFPGDPRAPRRPPLQRAEDPYPADPMAKEAAIIEENSLRGGVIVEPTAGYVYFPFEPDLDKVKTLELIYLNDEDGRKSATIRLR